jgi:hypothetical protein
VEEEEVIAIDRLAVEAEAEVEGEEEDDAELL